MSFSALRFFVMLASFYKQRTTTTPEIAKKKQPDAKLSPFSQSPVQLAVSEKFFSQNFHRIRVSRDGEARESSETVDFRLVIVEAEKFFVMEFSLDKFSQGELASVVGAALSAMDIPKRRF